MGNLRDLKAFVRYDGSGRVVAGSLIFRKKKPTIGNFQQIQSFKCCNDVTLTYTVATPTITDVTVRLFCNGTQINYLFTTRDSTTIASLITILNTTFNVLGVFSNPSGNIVQLVMSGEQKAALCPVGTLTFDVIAD
jgi:hypothetical protein